MVGVTDEASEHGREPADLPAVRLGLDLPVERDVRWLSIGCGSSMIMMLGVEGGQS